MRVAPNPDELQWRLADLVQVLSPDGFGSGRVVGRNLVLTARHVVGPLDAELPTTAILVTRYVALIRQANERIPAHVVWAPPRRADGRWPDIVLLQLEPPAGMGAIEPELSLVFAECPAKASPGWAVGFPWRVTADVATAGGGRVVGIEGGLAECNINGSCAAFSRSPPTLHFVTDLQLGRRGEADEQTAERWAGASGSVVVVDGRIVGVLEKIDATQVPNNQITVTPVFDHADARWRDFLPPPLSIAEAAKSAPATAREDGLATLSAFLYTLDRTDQLGLVDLDLATADDRALEILVAAHPDDLCHEFWKSLWCLTIRPGGPTPVPVSWPGAGIPTSRRPQFLVNEVAKKLDPEGPRPTSLDALVGTLSVAKQPPWVCVQLPEMLSDADLALLAAWRSAWSGIRRPPGRQGFGYVLLHVLDGPPAAALAHDAPAGPRQTQVSLDLVGPPDLRGWDIRLEALGATTGTSPLPRLARTLRDRAPATAVRLAAIQRLIDGGAAAPAQGTQPQWAA